VLRTFVNNSFCSRYFISVHIIFVDVIVPYDNESLISPLKIAVIVPLRVMPSSPIHPLTLSKRIVNVFGKFVQARQD